MIFDVNVLDAERQRITDKLLRNGYYKFNKDYVGYTADTVRGTYQVDLTLHLHAYRAHVSDSVKAHQQYWINKINFITDYDVLQSSALNSMISMILFILKGTLFIIKINSIYVRRCLLIIFALLRGICSMNRMCSRLIPISDVCPP